MAPSFTVIYLAVLLVGILLWVNHFVRRLPMDIRDLKKKHTLYTTRRDPEVLASFKTEERMKHYQQDCRLQYFSGLFIFVLFWIINIALLGVLYWVFYPIVANLVTSLKNM